MQLQTRADDTEDELPKSRTRTTNLWDSPILEYIPYAEAVRNVADPRRRNQFINEMGTLVAAESTAAQRFASLAGMMKFGLAMAGAPMGWGTTGTRSVAANIARVAQQNDAIKQAVSDFPLLGLATFPIDRALEAARYYDVDKSIVDNAIRHEISSAMVNDEAGEIDAARRNYRRELRRKGKRMREQQQ